MNSLIFTLLVFALFSAHAYDPQPQPEPLLKAIVGIRAQVPETARTARTLGTSRQGSGVVISESGLIVTIGYLILEASQVTVILENEREIPARTIAYDHHSGFGLVQPVIQQNIPYLPLGDSDNLTHPEPLLALAYPLQGISVRVVSRRPFAGSWEYLLENGIFTSPPHPNFGGAALINAQGQLLGVGSLRIGDAMGDGSPLPGNMFIPINALKEQLTPLLQVGRSAVAKPWLGIYANEIRGKLFVNRVAEGGPAELAGMQEGDVILQVADREVSDLANFYREIWKLGDAGTAIPLTVLRGIELQRLAVKSIDRHEWLRLNPSF